MAVDTRERLIAAGTGMFHRQGLAGTGVKQILAEAGAQFSSLYHHFPGGKDELAAEVIRTSGAAFQGLVEAVWDGAPNTVASVRAVFDGAAAVLEETDFADACPIAVIALEVASTNEPLRIASAEVFNGWLGAATTRLAAAGLSTAEARRLAVAIVCLLEGAFLLCRTTRSTEAMLAAGATAAAEVSNALTPAHQLLDAWGDDSTSG
jgi:AcrR family transcriptional regulator